MLTINVDTAHSSAEMSPPRREHLDVAGWSPYVPTIGANPLNSPPKNAYRLHGCFHIMLWTARSIGPGEPRGDADALPTSLLEAEAREQGVWCETTHAAVEIYPRFQDHPAFTRLPI